MHAPTGKRRTNAVASESETGTIFPLPQLHAQLRNCCCRRFCAPPTRSQLGETKRKEGSQSASVCPCPPFSASHRWKHTPPSQRNAVLLLLRALHRRPTALRALPHPQPGRRARRTERQPPWLPRPRRCRPSPLRPRPPSCQTCCSPERTCGLRARRWAPAWGPCCRFPGGCDSSRRWTDEAGGGKRHASKRGVKGGGNWKLNTVAGIGIENILSRRASSFPLHTAVRFELGRSSVFFLSLCKEQGRLFVRCGNIDSDTFRVQIKHEGYDLNAVASPKTISCS